MIRRNDIIKAKKRKRLLGKYKASIMGITVMGLPFIGAKSGLMSVKPVSAVTVDNYSRDAFLNTVSGFAREVVRGKDLYASVMVAQAILESGWGTSGLAQSPNHNLFGIKGDYKGSTAYFDTLEDDGSGNYYQIKDGFRKYPSYKESLEDYVDLLTGGDVVGSWRYNFYKGARKSNTKSYEDATAYLTGRYATDTRYGGKLNQIIRSYNLDLLDEDEGDYKGVENSEYKEPTVSVNGVEYGVVLEGEGLYTIAGRYGLSYDELVELNPGVANRVIYPGEKLVITNVGDTGLGKDNNEENTVKESTYIIESGDSLWGLSNKLGISVSKLVEWNPHLQGKVIYPGDVVNLYGEDLNNEVVEDLQDDIKDMVEEGIVEGNDDLDEVLGEDEPDGTIEDSVVNDDENNDYVNTQNDDSISDGFIEVEVEFEDGGSDESIEDSVVMEDDDSSGSVQGTDQGMSTRDVEEIRSIIESRYAEEASSITEDEVLRNQ